MLNFVLMRIAFCRGVGAATAIAVEEVWGEYVAVERQNSTLTDLPSYVVNTQKYKFSRESIQSKAGLT